MKPKYEMTLEQNLFLAKRNIIDTLWKSARLEGIAVTFPDTEALYNGRTVPGIDVDGVVKINNLKHAWQFIFDNIDYPCDYNYVCKLNQIVGANSIYLAGYLRQSDVSIGGTTWKPTMPIESEVKEKLESLKAIPGATDRAIETMLYLMRSQLFYDGNKRIAMLAANQILIAGGEGIISVPVEIQPEFSKELVSFYETGNPQKISKFVYEKCIDGINFNETKMDKEKSDKIKQLVADAGLPESAARFAAERLNENTKKNKAAAPVPAKAPAKKSESVNEK